MRAPRSIGSRRERDRLVASGRRVRRGPLTVTVVETDPERPARLTLAVRARGAVARNRAKRRLREAFRRCERLSGIDVLVRADAASLSVDFQEVVNHLCGAVVGAR